MVILIKSAGDHSNRLFQNLHFEAFCKEYNIEYINPSFANMHKFYQSPCKLYISKLYYMYFLIFLKTPLMFYIMKKLRLIKYISFNDDNIPHSLITKSDKNNIYVGGWCFRDNELTTKYQDYFICNYTLKEEYYKDNNLYLEMVNLKKNGNIIIGIHIRRGDYKLWNEGKYFFDDDVYMVYIQNMKNEIEIKYNRQCKFILFSNEPLSFVENENTYISKNNWYVDQFLMSKCDYLIGPPSTFTLWASYIGKVKCYHIEDKSGIINLENFNYCKG